MSDDLHLRRRAIYTGLKPFLDEEALLDALLHWEAHYASAPRFKLQHFVSELCRSGDLRPRRSDVLRSLIEAMSLPARSLLPDPLQRTTAGSASAGDVRAFVALAERLLDGTGDDQRFSLRLDLLASLDARRLPPPVLAALRTWLGERAAPLRLEQCSTDILRGLVNRIYVILCERCGPVEADRLLASAVRSVEAVHPELAAPLARLL